MTGSDPKAGKSPSVLNKNEILRCVSLYYLTRTFLSSVFTYAQNPMAFRHEYTKAPTTAPMLLSQFKYNVGFWPRQVAETVGNLVEFRSKPRSCSYHSAVPRTNSSRKITTLVAIFLGWTTPQL